MMAAQAIFAMDFTNFLLPDKSNLRRKDRKRRTVFTVATKEVASASPPWARGRIRAASRMILSPDEMTPYFKGVFASCKAKKNPHHQVDGEDDHTDTVKEDGHAGQLGGGAVKGSSLKKHLDDWLAEQN